MDIAVWDKLEATYKPRVIELANEIRTGLMEQGYRVSEVSDFTDEDLRVDLTVYLFGDDDSRNIDITLYLMDAATWDGTENGTSFSLDVVEMGGRMRGGLHPFNYTDDVWVDPTDEAAVEERWRIFKGAVDVGDIVRTLQEA